MEYIKNIQTVLIALAALMVALTLLIAVLKAKNLDAQAIIEGLTRLLQSIPPIRHTWIDEDKKRLENIESNTAKIEEHTRPSTDKPNGPVSKPLNL